MTDEELNGVSLIPNAVGDDPAFVRMAVLSTAHLPKRLALAMEWSPSEDPRNTPEAVQELEHVVFEPVEYGYLLWVTPGVGHRTEMPPEIQTLFAYADNNGCKWIKFDCDGPIINDLPGWEW